MSVSDIAVWQPKGTMWYQSNFINTSGKANSRGNSLGYFYAPMIYLDRKLCHKTRKFLYTNESGEVIEDWEQLKNLPRHNKSVQTTAGS